MIFIISAENNSCKLTNQIKYKVHLNYIYTILNLLLLISLSYNIIQRLNKTYFNVEKMKKKKKICLQWRKFEAEYLLYIRHPVIQFTKE